MAVAETGIIVVEVPYRLGENREEDEKRALEQRGLKPSDIGSWTIVFLTSYATC